ncbi:hypothetical protein KFZ58_15310 [Virgibacillus sp. NKC19-16]|uniref:hypothetical protein n=1 Tax=Virgibacillus salidurans TaxID=2831673 RepID=UPI001F438395|nr:hypothetical protein [Virgibacillus sp. NKC19-16]UJL45739.1 hypothetical protein KFZ58_15310 [Virgibacillus sp. NKC19-16]
MILLLRRSVQLFSVRNFQHNVVMMEIVDKLLPPCIYTEKEDLDFDELVRWVLEIIKKRAIGMRYSNGSLLFRLLKTKWFSLRIHWLHSPQTVA